MDRDKARKRAKAADAALKKGKRLGPLHGVPMTIKESFQVAGSPTTWGVPAMKDNVTESTAVLAQRMIDAGVTLFGKTNVPIMLADWQSYNAIYGTTNNPWDVSRTPGGSSGGSSAALAAGLTGIEAGQRHRLVDSQPGALLRRVRPQADLWARHAARPGLAGHGHTRGYFSGRSARALGAGSRCCARHHGGTRSGRWRLPEGRAAEVREDFAQAIPGRREVHRPGERSGRRVCRPASGDGRQARQGRSQGEGSRARDRYGAAL